MRWQRLVIFFCILLLGGSGLIRVITYSDAQIESQATISIADPEQALVATLGFEEQGGDVVLKEIIKAHQGDESNASFQVHNNLNDDISIDLSWQEIVSNVQFKLVGPSSIIPGNSDSIIVVVTAGAKAKPGYYRVPVAIYAEWINGSALLDVIVPVEILEAVAVDKTIGDKGKIDTSPEQENKFDGNDQLEGMPVVKPEADVSQGTEVGNIDREDDNQEASEPIKDREGGSQDVVQIIDEIVQSPPDEEITTTDRIETVNNAMTADELQVDEEGSGAPESIAEAEGK
jgi:hypothetical protein